MPYLRSTQALSKHWSEQASSTLPDICTTGDLISACTGPGRIALHPCLNTCAFSLLQSCTLLTAALNLESRLRLMSYTEWPSWPPWEELQGSLLLTAGTKGWEGDSRYTTSEPRQRRGQGSRNIESCWRAACRFRGGCSRYWWWANHQESQILISIGQILLSFQARNAIEIRLWMCYSLKLQSSSTASAVQIRLSSASENCFGLSGLCLLPSARTNVKTFWTLMCPKLASFILYVAVWWPCMQTGIPYSERVTYPLLLKALQTELNSAFVMTVRVGNPPHCKHIVGSHIPGYFVWFQCLAPHYCGGWYSAKTVYRSLLAEFTICAR